MEFPVRQETIAIVISGNVICPHCKMRLHPDKMHTEEECIVAQVMEYEEIGWSITEEAGMAIYNPRSLTKLKIKK